MKFLIDQDVYAVTAKFLIDAEHDVILVSEIGLAQASDEEILRVAQLDNRILNYERQGLWKSCFCEGNWNWCDLPSSLT
jgi:predicted nuclease of predicted toxin-antitoxin system